MQRYCVLLSEQKTIQPQFFCPIDSPIKPRSQIDQNLYIYTVKKRLVAKNDNQDVNLTVNA